MNTVSSAQSPLTGQGPGSLDLSKNLAMVFGTPVAVHQWPDSEAVNAELGTLVLAREAGEGGVQHSNVGGWHSKSDFFSWDADCVRTVRERVVRMVMEMTRVTMAEQIGDRKLDFGLKGWANVNRDRSYNLVHNHPNHVWSGTYYVATGDPENEGVVATVVWTAVATFIIVKVVKALVGLRVEHEEELEGLDVRTHGERGYLL